MTFDKPRIATAATLALLLLPSIAAAQFELPPYAFSWYADDPQDLAVDPAGNVYTVSTWPHAVRKYARDGNLILELVDAFEPGTRPEAVETDEAGNFYVVLGGPNRSSRLVKYGPDGTPLFVKYVSGTGEDVTVASDGNVYVTSTLPNTVTVYSPAGELVEKRDAAPIGRLSADDLGHYYLAEKYTRIVRKCDLSGLVLEEWTIDWSFRDVDVAADGTVLVAGGSWLFFYSPGGELLGKLDGFRSKDVWIRGIDGIGANALGDIYLADGSNHRVHMFGTRQDGDDPPYPPDVWPPLPPEPWPMMTPGHPASVILHLVDATADPCLPPAGLEKIVTSGRADPENGVPYHVYLLATPNTVNRTFTDGTAGLQLGIDYRKTKGEGTGLVVHDWHLCAVLDFADDDWPAPGTGNTITWGVPDCQQTDLAVAGYFTVTAYSPAVMSVEPWPNTGLVKVADCRGAEGMPDQELGLDRAGWVSVGGGIRGTDSDGCNPALEPCEPAAPPVRETTWGRIKTHYR